MKRWFYGIALFSITFMAGVVFVKLAKPVPVTFEAVPPTVEIPSMSKTNLRSTEPAKDFVPEFTNISIPDDYDSYVNLEYGDLGGCTKDERFRSTWMVFFKRGDKYSLERRKVRYGPRESDAWGGYYQMNFKNRKNALFLIQDTGKLRPGRVKTFFLATETGPYRDSAEEDSPDTTFQNKNFDEEVIDRYSESFEFEGSRYTIRTAPATTKEGDQVTALIVESGTMQQPIYYDDADTNYLGVIDWIGDMDGDRKLDLQFTFFAVNGGGSRSILFLSSMARKDELVRPYAFYFTRRYMECE